MSDKINHYSVVKEKSGFMDFLYNSEKGEIMGRTGLSWAKITIFYIIFFIGLGCFFGLMYFIFYKLIIDDKKPRWIGTDGLIGGNPGIGFRPLPDQDKTPESTLIWINVKNEMNNSPWADLVDEFINDNEKETGPGKECTYENGQNSTQFAYCYVNATKENALGKCSVGKSIDGSNSNSNKKRINKFGYTPDDFGPCVIVKLNKIYNWTPEPYRNLDDLKDAKKRGMPTNLMDRIEKYISSGTIEQRKLQTVWISCEGENVGDQEAMGDIEYFAPNLENFPGIPNYYFPYLNQPGYQTPFIMVKFLNPRKNTLIQIECKGWAKNIEADRLMRLGNTHFEIMIDGFPPISSIPSTPSTQQDQV